jgi:hypothetical protein
MGKKFLLSMLVVGALVCFAGAPLAQTAQIEERIAHVIIVNGQQVQGVMVLRDGLAQSYTCPSPQQYVLPDQSSSGWACLDPASGTWLMNASPLPTGDAYDQQPAYPNGTNVYEYYGYPYGSLYGYYPYPNFGYYGGPFLFGFGRGRHFEHEHGRAHIEGPHGSFEHRGVGHGSFGHGSIPHGGGGHMGGAHMGGGHR